MSAAALACVAATLLSVAALLAAEARGRRLGVWVAKPFASTGFVLLAWVLGASATPYGRWVLLALAASWLGDVLLIPRDARGAFLLGLLAFLLGHVLYVVAFVGLGFGAQAGIPAVLVVLASSLAALRWLAPHVEGPMRVAVGAYVAVISAMVVAAAGAAGATGRLAIPTGALLFYVSDLAVARQRFVAPSPANRLWGLPAYYAGQLVLAASVA